MSYTAGSQRRHNTKTGPGISLFPFLAVLICTMGALVPLLLAVSRTARQQAEAAAVARASELATQQQSELKTQQEDVRWRIEQLRKSREQTEKQLTDARLELGHLEDHARRLRQEVERCKNALTELERLEGNDSQQKSQAMAELERLRGEIAVAEQQVAEARKTAATQNRPYAVVPYEGPNQTRRRPIYLECRADAVILQPEGIRFTPNDLDGPTGPGNPLASALRAAREHMLAQRELDPNAGEPYPLLLVRPDGVIAYYAARQAMKSWGDDFGYELIGDDWKLAFQSPDGQLAASVQQAVTIARREQAMLIAAAPRTYGRRAGSARSGGQGSEGGGEPGYQDGAASVASAGGGYARAGAAGPVGANRGGGSGSVGGSYGSAATSGGPYANAGGGGSGRGGPYAAPGGGGPYASAGDEANRGDNAAYGAGNPFVNGNNRSGSPGDGPMLTGNGALGGGSVAGNSSAPVASSGRPSGGTSPGYAAQGSPGHGLQGTGGNATGGYGSPSASGNSYNAAGSQGFSGTGSGGNCGRAPSERTDGYIVGQPARERDTTKVADTAGYQPGRALKPGEWEPTPDNRPEKPPEKNDQINKKHDRREKPPINKNEDDWALRSAGRNSVGVTRPIAVQCFADRLVVLSDRGPMYNLVIPFGPRTGSSVDPLVRAVWEQMEGWGIAGRGMFWRPLLKVAVAPEAEYRFEDLKRLLDGSGLLLERK